MDYLDIGRVIVFTQNTPIWTILGSCVGVVLYSPRTQKGAFCHAQLPEKEYKSKLCSDSCVHPCFKDLPENNEFKYVTCSIEYMFHQLSKMGIKNTEIKVLIFGGSDLFKFTFNEISVGTRNLDTARKVLKNLNLQISQEDVGGHYGRKITFYPETGKAVVKILENSFHQ